MAILVIVKKVLNLFRNKLRTEDSHNMEISQPSLNFLGFAHLKCVVHDLKFQQRLDHVLLR